MTLQEFIKQYPIKTGLLTQKQQNAELSAFCMAIKLFKLMNWKNHLVWNFQPRQFTSENAKRVRKNLKRSFSVVSNWQ